MADSTSMRQRSAAVARRGTGAVTSTRQQSAAVTSTRQQSAAVTSTRQQSAAATSTRQQSAAVTSTRQQSAAATSTRQQSAAVTSTCQQTGAVTTTRHMNDSVSADKGRPEGSREKQRPVELTPDTSESQAQSATDMTSLLKLYRVKQWLQNRLLQSQGALDAVGIAASRADKERDLEKVLDRVAKLQKELQTAASNHTLGELLKQRLQLSNCLCQGLFPALAHDLPPALSSTLEPTQQQALRVLVDRQTQLNINICKTHKEILEKKPILIQLEKRNLELKHENRELMAQLLEGKQQIESSLRQCQHSKVIQRMERKLSEMVAQVNMMQHIFQCLILGSAVDWAADSRLCELMISLGKPLDMQLCLHDPVTLTDVSTHDS